MMDFTGYKVAFWVTLAVLLLVVGVIVHIARKATGGKMDSAGNAKMEELRGAVNMICSLVENRSWKMVKDGEAELVRAGERLAAAMGDVDGQELSHMCLDYDESVCGGDDAVYHPAHYRPGAADMIDKAIDGLSAQQGAAMFQAFKYYERAGKKGDLDEDLAKCNNFVWRACTGKFRNEQGGEDGQAGR